MVYKMAREGKSQGPIPPKPKTPGVATCCCIQHLGYDGHSSMQALQILLQDR